MPAKKKATKTKTVKKPTGRPSKYSPEICKEICERLSNGEPLISICKDSHMPCDDTVRIWASANETLFRDITRAREAGFDAIAMDCMHIADDNSKDTRMVKRGDEYIEVTDNDVIQRAKLRVETRLKLLAKWDPKRYGEKLDLNATHTGTINVVIGGNV